MYIDMDFITLTFYYKLHLVGYFPISNFIEANFTDT